MTSLEGLGESTVKNESSSLTAGYLESCVPAVLLLFALIPLGTTIHVTQNAGYTSTSLNCQPVQNTYPRSANAGKQIQIITTVGSPCISVDYNQIIVNILLPNTSVILSTASATTEPAVNTVTAPATGGPWSLTVQVLWIDYPVAGTLASFESAITIEINGPLLISTVTSHTASSTNFTSSRTLATSTVSSTITSVEVGSSTVIPNSTVTSLMNLTTTSLPPVTPYTTLNTSSSIQSDLPSIIMRYLWQNTTVPLILAIVVVVILLVGILVLKRRRR